MQFMIDYWWIWLLFSAFFGAGTYGLYLHHQKESQKKPFILLTAGCLGLIWLWFQIATIVSVVISVIVIFMKMLHHL